jgi:peptide deformylase
MTRENKDIREIINQSLRLEIHPGSGVLRQVARPVETMDDDIAVLAGRMLDFMRINDGVGLAAPQIGLSRRIFVAELNGQSFCIVNPQISQTSDCEMMEEGCLSLPGKAVVVKRPKQIQIQGLDTTGKTLCFTAAGLLARIFQHETDHLNGVMICDYET